MSRACMFRRCARGVGARGSGARGGRVRTGEHGALMLAGGAREAGARRENPRGIGGGGMLRFVKRRHGCPIAIAIDASCRAHTAHKLRNARLEGAVDYGQADELLRKGRERSHAIEHAMIVAMLAQVAR